MATLKTRIKDLEGGIDDRPLQPQIIVILGEDRDMEDIQTLGHNDLRRAAGESADDFIDRVAAHIAPGRGAAGSAIMLAGFADDDD